MTPTVEDLTYRSKQPDIVLARAEARKEFEGRFGNGITAMIERPLDEGYEFVALAFSAPEESDA